MIRKLLRLWPLAVALVVLGVVTASVLKRSLEANDGHLVYCLDDAYIHMAIARHLVEHGVFGVTPHEFSSSTSSPLWTLVLAGIWWVSGVSDWTPFALNLIAASGALVCVFMVMRNLRASGLRILSALLCLIYLTPLVTLIFIGMEHVLHVLLSIAFSLAAASVVSANRADFRGGIRLLAPVLGFLLVGARFEGLFLAGIFVILMLVCRRPSDAAALAASSTLPVAIYGIVSMAQGSGFLPNSLILKGNMPRFEGLSGVVQSLGYRGLTELTAHTPHLHVLSITMLVLYLANSRREFRDVSQILLLAVTGTVMAHLQFAGTGWFYRYEAYLVALGVVAVALSLPTVRVPDSPCSCRSIIRIGVGMLVAAIVIMPLYYRGKQALRETVRATNKTYEKEYTAARFLRLYYNGESVAACDIGAINYYADLKCLDMFGIGSFDVLKARKADRFGPEELAEFGKRHGCEVAFRSIRESEGIDDFRRSLPGTWKIVGYWTVADNIGVSGLSPALIAIGDEKFARLRSALISFRTNVPSGIVDFRVWDGTSYSDPAGAAAGHGR